MRYMIHFVCANNIQPKRRQLANDVPRVGDELRFSMKLFGKVERVIWVYDEDSGSATRVNIAVTYEEGD